MGFSGADGWHRDSGSSGPNGTALPYGNDVGVLPNTYITTLSGPPPVNTPGFTFEMRVAPGHDNTGASTLDIGLGPLAITDSDLNPLTAGMMEGDSIYLYVFNPTGLGSYQLLGLAKPQPEEEFGYTARVDKVFGNDATGAVATIGSPSGQPFLTIGAALTAAGAVATANTPVIVWVFPGKYDESITIPAFVSVVGMSVGAAVTIQKLLVTAATTLVTMGENSRIENFTLLLTSAEHHTLKGIVLPGTTSLTARLRTLALTVDNSTALVGGSSDVYGIHSNGTGTPTSAITIIRASTVTVNSIGGGAKRGVLVDTANKFHLRDTNVSATSFGGAGTFIGVETNHASAEFTAHTSSLRGSTADISQTLGTIIIATTDLETATANGKFFSLNITPMIVIWGDQGTLGTAAVRYMRFGTDAVSTSESRLKLGQKAIAKGLRIKVEAPANATRNHKFTVRRNGVDTLLTATLLGGSVTVENMVDSVHFDSGDDISMKVEALGAGTPAANDTIVAVDLY